MWESKYERSLYHHGIKGQEWGVRNGPPYPLDKSDRSSKEKRASGSSVSGKGTSGLSDSQKKALLIAGAAAVAGVAAYKMYKSGDFRYFVDVGKQMLGQDIDYSKLSLSSRAINPIKHKTGVIDRFTDNEKWLGARMNCGNCTIANELRHRGGKLNNVEAHLNPNGMLPENLGQFFKGITENSIKSFRLPESVGNEPSLDPRRGSAVKDVISSSIKKSFPSGSRGNLYIPMTFGNHFISWQIKGDKVVFENPQDTSLNLSNLFGMVDMSTSGGRTYGIRATRLDNLEINRDTISKVVSKAGEGKNTGFNPYDIVLQEFTDSLLKKNASTLNDITNKK